MAGTRSGITACQLDVCLPEGVPVEVLGAALHRARLGRLRVLDALDASLARRGERGAAAPVVGTVQVRRGSRSSFKNI